MKITRRQLRGLIKEELSRALLEDSRMGMESTEPDNMGIPGTMGSKVADNPATGRQSLMDVSSGYFFSMDGDPMDSTVTTPDGSLHVQWTGPKFARDAAPEFYNNQVIKAIIKHKATGEFPQGWIEAS